MKTLELLAPARDLSTGIAAIDCGADAVYMAGPEFGARKAAGNSFEDIAALIQYAHKFGARVFVTFNTTIGDDELQRAHSQMLLCQDAGADAFIIRDERICMWEDIKVPLHASTQCAIRDERSARHFEESGCSRIILERELDLKTVSRICSAVNCEVEFFVHGALCVGYSGECRLSEYLDGRSADRGECIQACRSLYDLVDASGRTLVRKKALLSLKDYNLKEKLEELADAGVVSFKIEGRLKNVSYVRNIVRDYSLALDSLVSRRPEDFRRASWGRISGGFVPDAEKTFNRGYTRLWIDGTRDRWCSMDSAGSLGQRVGVVDRITRNSSGMEVTLKGLSGDTELHNGDGFAFPTRDGLTGFRSDLCSGRTISGRDIPDLVPGTVLYRNLNTAFEKSLDSKPCHREIPVALSVLVHGRFNVDITARSQDGREVFCPFCMDVQQADNAERAEAMLRGQLSKRSDHYVFSVESLQLSSPGRAFPLLSASTINSMRRLVASDLDSLPCRTIPLAGRSAVPAPSPSEHPASGIALGSGIPRPLEDFPLLKTKYCIRYELGMCPCHQGAAPSGPLFLVNNGRRLALSFDCGRCEMSVLACK